MVSVATLNCFDDRHLRYCFSLSYRCACGTRVNVNAQAQRSLKQRGASPIASFASTCFWFCAACAFPHSGRQGKGRAPPPMARCLPAQTNKLTSARACLGCVWCSVQNNTRRVPVYREKISLIGPTAMVPADILCSRCVQTHSTWNQERKRGFLLALGRRSTNNHAWCSSVSATGSAGTCSVEMCTGVIAPARLASRRHRRLMGRQKNCMPPVSDHSQRRSDLGRRLGGDNLSFVILYKL